MRHHGRRGHRRRLRRDRPAELSQGLPAAAPGRAADHVRALRGPDGRQARHPGGAAQPGADAAGDDAVVEEPADHEREQGRLRAQHALVVGPRGPRPGARAARPRASRRATTSRSSPRRSRSTRAADAHRFIAERKNVGKVVLTPEWTTSLASIGSEFQREIVDSRPARRVPLLRRAARHVRLHPHQHPHDPRPGELVAGQRRGRRHPRPPPGLGDHRDDDLRLHRDRPCSPDSPWREIVAVVLRRSARG